MENMNLKPCFFCERDSVRIVMESKILGECKVYAKCKKCGATGPERILVGVEDAEVILKKMTEYWNQTWEKLHESTSEDEAVSEPLPETEDKPVLEDCPDCHGEMIVAGNDIMRNVILECVACKKRHILKGCKKAEDAPKFWKKKLGVGRFDN